MSLVRTVSTVGLRVGLGLTVGLTVSECLCWLFRRFWPRCGSRGPLKEAFFFPSETGCVEHLFTPSIPIQCTCPLPHGLETSFSRLLGHILSATTSLDLCVFAFTNSQLSRALLMLHNRGVAIRILTDMAYTLITGSQLGTLRRAGIIVRCDKAPEHMHHKFAVADGRRLIMGSLNWTAMAIWKNMENILVTEEPDLVQPFIGEFQRLWDVNDPEHRHPPYRSEA